MKKTTALLLSLIFIYSICCLSGCSDNAYIENYCVDSRVSYVLSVPRSTDSREYSVFINAPFYRVFCNDDDFEDYVNGRDKLKIGVDAKLYGSNVEELNGSYVYIDQLALNECVSAEYYYERLAYCEAVKFMEQEDNGELDEKLYKKVKNISQKYMNKCKVLSLNLVVDGCICNDITIERLEIPAIGVCINFDTFKLNTFEVPEGVVIGGDSPAIEYSEFGGVFADAVVSNVGYLPVVGICAVDIENVNVTSLNNVCEVVNSSNYAKYQQLEEYYGPLYSAPKENNYVIDSDIQIEYSYVFRDDVESTNVDATMASLVVKVTSADGNEWWDCVYQPSIIDAPYLILPAIHEEINR